MSESDQEQITYLTFQLSSINVKRGRLFRSGPLPGVCLGLGPYFPDWHDKYAPIIQYILAVREYRRGSVR